VASHKKTQYRCQRPKEYQILMKSAAQILHNL
jgi:hypothetical protein